MPVRGAIRWRWACAWAECSPSPGRGRYGGTCARAYCRPGCRAPDSRTTRSSDRRSRWGTWRGAPRRTPPPPPRPLARARAPLSLLACQLEQLLFVPLPFLTKIRFNHHIIWKNYIKSTMLQIFTLSASSSACSSSSAFFCNSSYDMATMAKIKLTR